MNSHRLNTGSRFLVVLLFTALALPAWGATLTKKTIYGKVAIVAQSGGDYTSPVTAMTNVATWCGTPSAANPCLAKIMPGVYDLGSGHLDMQPYVDIEGSGEGVTVITSVYAYDPSSEPKGVVNGADNAELRFLTVQSKSDYPNPTLAIANNGQSPKITNVSATASGGNSSWGVINKNSSTTMSNLTVKVDGGYSNQGVTNYNSSATMSNVTVTVEFCDLCVGVKNEDSSLTMTNITVRASGGTSNIGLWNTATSAATILVDRSTFETGSGEFDRSVRNSNNVTLKIGASKLTGTVENSGTLTCAASYNGDCVALGTNCQ